MGADLGRIRKICVKESMYINQIKEVTGIKVTEIKEGAVIVEINFSFKLLSISFN